LPSQTSNSGKYLTTNGTAASWAAVAGSVADPTEPASPTDGLIWVDTDATAVGNQVVRWSKATANGTTTLSGNDDSSVPLGYVAGYEQVYQNGVLLARGGDYTATNGSTIALTNASVTGDIFEVFASSPVAIVDTYTQTQANAAFIPKTLTTTTGDIIYASGANTPARLGIGSTDQVLKVSGGLPTWSTLSTTPTAVGAQVLRTTTQVITGGTTTAVSWSSAGTNTDSIWSSGSATRFTIPSGKSGVYQVSTSITFNNASGQVQFYIYKNGTALTNYSYVTALNGSNINGGSMNAILTLAAADYIEIFVKSNNTAEIIAGVSLASIFYIGA